MRILKAFAMMALAAIVTTSCVSKKKLQSCEENSDKLMNREIRILPIQRCEEW